MNIVQYALMKKMFGGTAGGGGGGGGETDTENKLAMLVSGTLEEITAKDLEGATRIEQYAFYYNSGLKSIVVPNTVTKINTSAFQYCSGLTSVTIPNSVTSFSSTFRGCKSLTDVIMLAKITSLQQDMFYDCSLLVNVTISPTITHTMTNCFRGCSKLEFLELPNVLILQSNAFYNCTLLNTLVLRKSDAICTLSGTSAFSGTPFASGGTGGTVYVPQALIEQYQQATNWSTLYAAGTCNFVAIEGSEYE